jgi:UDP-3-O-[3-hydroxymyristoyl] glucosamine N-acyltransferase
MRSGNEDRVTVGELIQTLGGELKTGDAQTRLTGVASAESAEPSHLVFAENTAAVALALTSSAGALVAPEGALPNSSDRMVLVSSRQPRLWFAQAAKLLRLRQTMTGVHPAAVIAESARLGESVSIGSGSVIGEDAEIGDFSRIDAGAVIGEGARVGANCHVYPRAVLYPGTQLGDRVTVHAGAVLGADGFGYVRDRESGKYTQFPQQGILVIEDDVEIGANTTIDRGALAETRIRRGAKIDNLVHVGHNCDVGEDVVIAAQVGISGSSTIGHGAVLAGQVGIGDHAHVGDGVILGGQAGVLSGKTVATTGTVLWGTPAKPLREYLRELATLSRLAKRKKD